MDIGILSLTQTLFRSFDKLAVLPAILSVSCLRAGCTFVLNAIFSPAGSAATADIRLAVNSFNLDCALNCKKLLASFKAQPFDGQDEARDST